MPTRGDVTELLLAYRQGDYDAFSRMYPLVYDELRRIARRQLGRGTPDRILDTTSLVHESYLKMVDQKRVDWQDRGHFLACAAQAMRQVIITYARRRNAAKRGGRNVQTTLDERRHMAIDEQTDWLLAVDAALNRLNQWNPRLARVVECRFFAGLSEEETATALSISLRTAQRDWMKARAYLREELLV
ncbi:MAG TPA: sigma-70 family RNA polymerase sigma factor [Thermoanaerobaculia bacterium]